MIKRVSEDKINLNTDLLKEVGYILLLTTFFVGIIIGSFALKNVNTTSFDEYTESLNETISKINQKDYYINSNKSLYSGVTTIVLFWIVGMSVVGSPILVLYLGYKGYSIGYTISTVIKLQGMTMGNEFVFKYLFMKNLVLVFIMIFLANHSIKISKNFLEKKTNIKNEVLKYTVIVCFMLIGWIGFNFLEKMIFTTF